MQLISQYFPYDSQEERNKSKYHFLKKLYGEQRSDTHTHIYICDYLEYKAEENGLIIWKQVKRYDGNIIYWPVVDLRVRRFEIFCSRNITEQTAAFWVVS